MTTRAQARQNPAYRLTHHRNSLTVRSPHALSGEEIHLFTVGVWLDRSSVLGIRDVSSLTWEIMRARRVVDETRRGPT